MPPLGGWIRESPSPAWTCLMRQRGFSSPAISLAGCAVLAGGLAALALAGCGGAHGEAPKKPAELPVLKAEVLNVQPRSWPTVVKAQGSLMADEVTVVGAKVSGRVAEILVD